MHTWKRMSIEEKTFRAVGYTLITGFAILCLIPFLIIIASSFSSESYIIQHGYDSGGFYTGKLCFYF